jgi:ubiquinol-cytochrome c reductase cytochrome b subunit/cytochrome b6
LPSTAGSSGFSQAVAGAGDWLKTRIANIDIFDEHYSHEMKTNPFYALGPIFYLVWFIVMATGCILIMWYVPTKASAFDSIFDIQWKIPFGGLMRGMHKYGADAMIIAATMRMYRIFLMGDYKPGKEFNVAIGLVALLLSMYSGLTGYLLIWNQRAFWATKVFATFPTYMDQFPVMGDFYQPLIKSFHLGWNTAEILLGGGAAITQETITRFFSLHLAFSLIPLIFVELYFYKNAYTRIPLNWTKRWVIILMLAVVAVILPAAQGRRSNPDVTPLPILSDWYFLGLYQMYKYLEPVVATEITIVIPLSVVLLPFIDVALTGPEKDIMKRPLMLMVSFMALATWIVFSYLIIINVANIHNDPPYWRMFFYFTIDIGILWQLALIWMTPDVVQRVKGAKTAFGLGIMAAVQTFLGFTFYYMAQTEIFMDPMWHQFIYRFVRMGFADQAQKVEDAIRQIVVPMNSTLAYNQDFISLCKDGFTKVKTAPAGIETLTQMSGQSTPLDFLFSWYPSFANQPYKGALDFMICNRWAYDYVNFTERMAPGHVTGPLGPYPLKVPDLDMVWINVSWAVMLVAFGTWFWCKSQASRASSAQPTPAQPQQASA